MRRVNNHQINTGINQRLGPRKAVISHRGSSRNTQAALLIFGGIGAAARSYWLGIYASAICVVLFASPLSTIASVLKTGNSESILAPLTLAQIANTLMWTVYGVFAAKDVFVWGPNGAGLGLGLIQLALKFCFPANDES